MSTILHIEDEIEYRKDMCFLLQEHGFNTIEADDGIQGLEILSHTTPDLILCDIKTPNISGFDVIKQIRNKNNYVPFIFLTGLREDQDIIKGVKLLADDYITKPIPLSVLVAKIDAAIARNKLQNPEKTKKHSSLKKAVEDCTARILRKNGNLLKPIVIDIEQRLPNITVDRALLTECLEVILSPIVDASTKVDKTYIVAGYDYSNESVELIIRNNKVTFECMEEILSKPALVSLAKRDGVRIKESNDMSTVQINFHETVLS